MQNRVSAYLEKFNIPHDYQFGFRKFYSTFLALIEVIDSISGTQIIMKKTIGVYLDLQKAFDTVNHVILIHKLSIYSIRSTVLSWF